MNWVQNMILITVQLTYLPVTNLHTFFEPHCKCKNLKISHTNIGGAEFELADR